MNHRLRNIALLLAKPACVRKSLPWLSVLIFPLMMGSVGKPPLHLTILPLGDVEDSTVRIVQQALTQYYHAEAVVASRQADIGMLYKEGGDTIIATEALSMMDALPFAGEEKVVGVTDKGITLGGNFIIRGFAKLNGKSCIVSSRRISEETGSPGQYKVQLGKTALHEAGHTLGLEHCQSGEGCFMVSSMPNPAAFYGSPLDLCSDCKRKVSAYLK